MSLLGPQIFKINGGLGQQEPSDQNVGGLIVCAGYEVGSTLQFDTVYELNSLEDAEALGLKVSTDANAAAAGTSALTWYHISEFFRVNPDGKLWLYNGEAVAASGIFSANGPADQLMAASNHSVRFIGVVFGFDPGAAVVISEGFATGVAVARAAAQTWLDAREQAFMYVDCVILEGYGASPTTVDLKATDAPGVLICTACDRDYLEQNFGVEELHLTGAVGLALGSIGVRKLSESIASVVIERLPAPYRGRANYSVVDTRMGRWLNPALSTGVYVSALTRSQSDDLKTKAYCYVDQYAGYPGAYFSSEATCTLASDDFNTIRTNRLWCEAARRVRFALVPRMESKVAYDVTTGKIKASTIADWDAAARRELERMVADGDLADFTFSLDPNQDVVAQGKVMVRIRIIPDGIAKGIEVELGFLNPTLVAA